MSGSNEMQREQAPHLYRHFRQKLQCPNLTIRHRIAFRAPDLFRLGRDQGRNIVGETGGTGGVGGVGDLGEIKPDGGDGGTTT